MSATAFVPMISLAAAIRDTNLLGGPFTAPTFWTWKTVAKILDGEQLDEREAALFRQCTGRERLPQGPVHRMIVLAGRRAGKDRFLSAAAVHRAALWTDWNTVMSAGESAVVLLLGADKKQASILRRYCEGLLRAPLLAPEVVRSTDDVASSATVRCWKLPPTTRGSFAVGLPLPCSAANVATGARTNSRPLAMRRSLRPPRLHWPCVPTAGCCCSAPVCIDVAGICIGDGRSCTATRMRKTFAGSPPRG
jgi:hypothetical protein